MFKACKTLECSQQFLIIGVNNRCHSVLALLAGSDGEDLELNPNGDKCPRCGCVYHNSNDWLHNTMKPIQHLLEVFDYESKEAK